MSMRTPVREDPCSTRCPYAVPLYLGRSCRFQNSRDVTFQQAWPSSACRFSPKLDSMVRGYLPLVGLSTIPSRFSIKLCEDHAFYDLCSVTYMRTVLWVDEGDIRSTVYWNSGPAYGSKLGKQKRRMCRVQAPYYWEVVMSDRYL